MVDLDRTFPQVLAEKARKLGPRAALTLLPGDDGPGETFSFEGLWDAAQAMAAGLQARGLAPGDRVALIFPNDADFTRAFCGVLTAGMIAVPVAPPRNRAGIARVDALIANAGAALVLYAPDLAPQIARLRTEVSAPAGAPGWTAFDAFAQGQPADFQPPALGPEDIAVIQYTSGSTGAQKGVMVRHRNLMSNAAALGSVCGMGEGMRMVSWLPFFHDWGLFGCLVFPLVVEGRAWLYDPADFLRDPRRWVELMAEHRATVACAPDFAYRLAADLAEGGTRLDLSAWRMAMLGAEPIRAATLDRFARAWGPQGFAAEALYPSYGLAENTLIATGYRPGEPWRQSLAPTGRQVTNCGAALAGQRIAVVDAASGAALPDGQMGELWVTGPSVTAGYWQNPAATAATYGARLAGDKAPWLRTGDLAFLRGGDLHICGRIKDVIIKAGENYLAEDLEIAVAGAHAALRDGGVAAFAIEAAGAERLVLVAEVNWGPRPDLAPLVPALQKALSAGAGVMADAVAILPPGKLEKTSSGKVRRAHTRDEFLAGRLAPLHLWQGWA